jgi:Flp pilus assembly pilin Flp
MQDSELMRCPPPRPIRVAFARLGAELRAVTAIEYALIAAFMAMVIVTGVSLFGGDLGVTYGHVSDGLIGASNASAPASSAPTSTPAAPASTPGTSGASNSTPGPTVQTDSATIMTPSH